MENRKRSTAEKMKIYKGLFGTSSVADQENIVCIPDKLRMRHVHLIGRPSMGMSTLIEHMIMDDIEKGHGVAIMDPNGDLVEGLLHLMPKEANREKPLTSEEVKHDEL